MSTFNITDETKKKKDQMDVSLANMDKAAADYNKMNYGGFVQGDDYKALSQRYQQNGQMAMKDTLGQMAARTGGMASSYANTASQQAYNGYMEKLEDAARSLYDSQRQEKMDALSVASSIYDRDRAAYETGYANDYKLWEEDYDRGRDAKADADALKSEWITTISDAAYNENGLNYKLYKDNIPKDANGNPIISEAEFNALVNAAMQTYKSDTWQQKSTESEKQQAENAAEIEAMLANGMTRAEIATKLGIGGTNGKTWKDVTGMSEAEWEYIETQYNTPATYSSITDPDVIAKWKELIFPEGATKDHMYNMILQLAQIDPGLAARFATEADIEFDIE